MDTKRQKYAADWFYSHVFRDESIRPREAKPAEKVPPLIRTARSLEHNTVQYWQSRESVFLKQGKLLAGYEDDYEFEGSVVRYFPTYQSLTDQELRGYFSWRTKLRRGDVRKTSLSFAFLYIYELLNQIGVESPLDGYGQLEAFRDAYGQLDSSILSYLKVWMTDYVIYYDLDPALLGDSPQVLFDRAVTVLDHVRDQEEAKVIWAVKQLSPKWLERSKFYSAYQADMDTVIVGVLRRISDHYAARCKKTMVEQYFGQQVVLQVRLFETAVFHDRMEAGNREFVLDERCVYTCVNGLWSVRKHTGALRSNGKLADLIKTIDALMREEYGYKHPVKAELDTKWICKIIREEVRALLQNQKEAEAKKIRIDYASLARIRADAAVTRDKLIVEEELEEELPLLPEAAGSEALEGIGEETTEASRLSPEEYRLLQCLLYGRNINWVQAEGYMLSVLSDSINDKLYDRFLDSVMDDTPELVEDYIDDLKEMVHP